VELEKFKYTFGLEVISIFIFPFECHNLVKETEDRHRQRMGTYNISMDILRPDLLSPLSQRFPINKMRLIIRDTQDKAAQYIADYIFIKELAF
jgi:hypothetical protein